MATQTDIYRDIATRTGGDIYIGVVGPVRTGKSTFIKKFMETLVIPIFLMNLSASARLTSCLSPPPENHHDHRAQVYT